MHNVTFRIEKINLTLFIMSVFLILSFLFDRGLFTEAGDGFFYQIESVRKSEELGSLWFIHNFRYYLVSPFLIFDNFAYQSLVFFIYIWFPGFFLRGRLRIAVYILLFFSLFFSYRSVLTMASISFLVSSVIMKKKTHLF